MNLPNFTAHDVNRLAQLALKSEYYGKCLKFVKQYLDLNDKNAELLTDKQKGWLWGIKADLKED
jgi:hypothetical protein